MADPTKPSKAGGSYAVGYKKPPTEHQFKSKQLGDSPIKRARKEKVPDLAGLFDKPLQVKRGGKTIAVHPYEAELMSLGKRALKGEPRATKLFLKRCEIAGLLDPAPAEQTHGLLVIPKGVNWAITRVLLETHGFVPKADLNCRDCDVRSLAGPEPDRQVFAKFKQRQPEEF